jgi:hypothetical protein
MMSEATKLFPASALGLVTGTRVFCCDNLAFSGEVALNRKHTVNVFRDLPDLIYQMLSKVSGMRERQDSEIAAWKARELRHPKLTTSWWRRSALGRCLPRIFRKSSRRGRNRRTWSSSLGPRTAWSLFNAFTELAKSRSPRAQIEDTLRVTEVFRRELGL